MYSHSVSDEELFQYLKVSDDNAYTALYERYKKPLLIYALKKVDPIAAEDLVHDFFVKLWANREHLFVKERFSSYAFRALRNRILDYIAHSAVADKYLSSLEDFSLTQFSDKADYKLREELFLQNIDKILINYGPRSVSIVRLRIQGYSNAEIAEKLNVSEKTIRNQYSLLTKVLKNRLPSLIFISFF